MRQGWSTYVCGGESTQMSNVHCLFPLNGWYAAVFDISVPAAHLSEQWHESHLFGVLY